jgi:hypothetical protein
MYNNHHTFFIYIPKNCKEYAKFTLDDGTTTNINFNDTIYPTLISKKHSIIIFESTAIGLNNVIEYARAIGSEDVNNYFIDFINLIITSILSEFDNVQLNLSQINVIGHFGGGTQSSLRDKEINFRKIFEQIRYQSAYKPKEMFFYCVSKDAPDQNVHPYLNLSVEGQISFPIGNTLSQLIDYLRKRQEHNIIVKYYKLALDWLLSIKILFSSLQILLNDDKLLPDYVNKYSWWQLGQRHRIDALDDLLKSHKCEVSINNNLISFVTKIWQQNNTERYINFDGLSCDAWLKEFIIDISDSDKKSRIDIIIASVTHLLSLYK